MIRQSIKHFIGGIVFLLSLLVYTLPCENAFAQTVVSSHPRVWLTPARLSRLKTAAAANSARWAVLKSTADRLLVDASDQNYSALPDLCLVYAVTGDTRYSAMAEQIL